MNIEFEVEFKGEGKPTKVGKGEIVFNVVLSGAGHKVEKKESK